MTRRRWKYKGKTVFKRGWLRIRQEPSVASGQDFIFALYSDIEGDFRLGFCYTLEDAKRMLEEHERGE